MTKTIIFLLASMFLLSPLTGCGGGGSSAPILQSTGSAPQSSQIGDLIIALIDLNKDPIKRVRTKITSVDLINQYERTSDYDGRCEFVDIPLKWYKLEILNTNYRIDEMDQNRAYYPDPLQDNKVEPVRLIKV